MTRTTLGTLNRNKRRSNQQLAAKNVLNFNPWQKNNSNSFEKSIKE